MTEKQILQYKTAMFYDMEYFGRMCIPQAFTMPSPPVHFEIYNALQDDTINKLLVVVPRGIGKSTITGLVLPLHSILFSPKGEFQVILLVSKTPKHTQRLIRNIRLTLNNSEIINTLWGDWGCSTFIKETEDTIILKDGSMIAGLSILNQIAGFNHNSQRPTWLIPDDIEYGENTKTNERRQTNRDWFFGEALPCIDPVIGRVVMDATIYHRDCIAMNLRDDPTWHTIWYGSTINAENKEVLWPERFSWDWLQKQRMSMKINHQEHIYFMQYENKVTGGEDALFQPDDIQYYDGEIEFDKKYKVAWLKLKRIYKNGKWENKEEIIPLKVFIGVDPAKSVTEGSDYTVIMVIGVSPKRIRYILEIWRKRVRPFEISKAIIDVYLRWKDACERINVEDVLFSELVADNLKEQLEEKNEYISIYKVPVPKSEDKKQRYQSSISSDFTDKKVFLLENMRDFEDELLSFPRAKHDDTIDGYWLATRKIYPAEDLKYVEPGKRNKIKKNVEYTDWRGL